MHSVAVRPPQVNVVNSAPGARAKIPPKCHGDKWPWRSFPSARALSASLPTFLSPPTPTPSHAFPPIRRALSLLHILRKSMVASPKGYAQSRVSVLSTTQNDQLINLQAIHVATSLVHFSSSSLFLAQVSCLGAWSERFLIYTWGPRGCSIGNMKVRAQSQENAV